MKGFSYYMFVYCLFLLLAVMISMFVAGTMNITEIASDVKWVTIGIASLLTLGKWMLDYLNK